MNFPQTLIAGCIVIPAAFAQFGPYFYDVRNSASYATLIAQGSIFTVFGEGIGPARLEQANSYPLPLQVGGTSMQILTGGKRLDCPMISSSNRQSAAILPSSTPPGEVTLNVNYGGKNASGTIQVVTSVFGAYTTDSSGTGAAIVTGLDYGLKSFTQSARPGETLLLWGTGLGAIDGSDASVPVAGKQFSDVEVFVGNLPAKITYVGRSGCCAGLDQIAFEIPASRTGCFVPIAVRTNGIVSNFTTLPVSRAGPSCSNDPPGVPASILSRVLAGEEVKVGAIALGPVRILESAGFPFSRRLANTLSAILQKRVSEEDAGRLVGAYRTRRRGTARIILKKYGVDPKNLDPRLVKAVRNAAAMDEQGVGVGFGRLRSVDGSLTSKLAANFTAPGTCIVTRGFPNYRSFLRSSRVDAGPTLTFDGPMGRRTLSRASNGQYMLSLGSGFANATLPTGRYTVTDWGAPTSEPSVRLLMSAAL